VAGGRRRAGVLLSGSKQRQAFAAGLLSLLNSPVELCCAYVGAERVNVWLLFCLPLRRTVLAGPGVITKGSLWEDLNARRRVRLFRKSAQRAATTLYEMHFLPWLFFTA